jgi:uncharacterized protein (TIGR03083 family)
VTAIDKTEVERKLDAEWQALREAIESFSDEELEAPGAVDEWSVKDLLGHMAFWANKAAHDLDAINAGEEGAIQLAGGQEGVDAWNARESEARKDKPLPEMKAEWEASFEAARQALSVTPAEKLEIEVQGWNMFTRFAEDTYRHYREHAAQIREWKREVETTEE